MKRNMRITEDSIECPSLDIRSFDADDAIMKEVFDNIVIKLYKH